MKDDAFVLKGAKIVSIESITVADAEAQGFLGYDAKDCANVMKVVLDNGKFLLALQDEEGNGPGCMVIGDKDGNSWYVREEK